MLLCCLMSVVQMTSVGFALLVPAAINSELSFRSCFKKLCRSLLLSTPSLHWVFTMWSRNKNSGMSSYYEYESENDGFHLSLLPKSKKCCRRPNEMQVNCLRWSLIMGDFSKAWTEDLLYDARAHCVFLSVAFRHRTEVDCELSENVWSLIWGKRKEGWRRGILLAKLTSPISRNIIQCLILKTEQTGLETELVWNIG